MLKMNTIYTELDASGLRRKALNVLKLRPLLSASDVTVDELIFLAHEMEVLQIELELQNEELIIARSIAQISSDKYLQLYNFAPSGYLTLTEEGEIIESNHCVEDLLDKKSTDLVNSKFGFFITDDTKPAFNLFLEKAFQSNVKEYCEVTISSNGNESKDVKITGIVIGNNGQCLVNLNVISTINGVCPH